ncbi:MAG: hypothetical protein ACP5KN_08675 [Armatimonadota bacterium]
MARYVMVTLVCMLMGAGAYAGAADAPARVTVHNPGPKVNRATWECTPGHEIRRQQIALASGARSYTIQLQGCLDPSHGDQHPCNEGTFGMPAPSRANWYWGGFMQVLINGVNATLYQEELPRVLETGDRGLVQLQWAHPAADVGLRLMMLPGGNHLLADLQWRPREDQTVETVALRLTCYPSFFTAARNRSGDRRCMTPRTEAREGETLELVPGQDTWLYYYDTVFDVANGEGDGPCAALLAPAGVTGGSVTVGGYAVTTSVDLAPAEGGARLGFYDFTGMTNAEAERYMQQHGAEDLARLTDISFRPEPVRELDLGAFTAETTQLLDAAGEDGEAMRPEVEKLVQRVTVLKPQADAGDWAAEADLAELLRTSSDLLWKLRAFSVLNE